MIRVTASILARTQDTLIPDKLWSRKVADCTLLEHTLSALQAVPELDQCFVLTDDQNLLSQQKLQDAFVLPISNSLRTHTFNLLTHEYWRIHYELDGLRESFPLGDVHFYITWQTPLLTSRTLEFMYHTLLEDGGG